MKAFYFKHKLFSIQHNYYVIKSKYRKRVEHYKLKCIIKLDPLQQLHRLFMVLQKYARKVLPCRPILASYDSFAYECAVWLSEILTPLREHPSNINDTFDFVSRILSSKPGPNHTVSFDVKSLFTNTQLIL